MGGVSRGEAPRGNPDYGEGNRQVMVELENPVDNPCFGCGPRHPRGLHLRFEQVVAPDGVAEIRAPFTPQSDEIGWPTVFHHGLHFSVLYEVSYWTALTLGERLWVSDGPISYTARRLPRVGVAHVAQARIVSHGPDSLSIRATTATVDGKPCGVLESGWVPARREAVERAGIPLPDYLLSEIRA